MMSTTYEPRRRRRVAPCEAEKIDRCVDWHATAPVEVRRAAGSRQAQSEWQAWTTWLARRRRPKLPRLLRTAISPLVPAVCSLTEVVGSRALLDLLWRVARGKRRAAMSAVKLLPSWLADAEVAASGGGYARECLAWCHALPQLAEHATADVWWALFWHLLDAASDAQRSQPSADPLAAALLGAELSLALAVLLPEIDDCRRAAEPAAAWLGRLMMEQADEALFALNQLHLLRPTLACWTRSRGLAACWSQMQVDPVCRKGSFVNAPDDKVTPGRRDLQGDGDVLSRDARRAFRRVLLGAMRWTLADGRQLLATGDTEQTAAEGTWVETKTLISAAVKQDGSRTSRRVWRSFRKLKQGRRGSARKLPCAGSPYEASSTAVLRSSWSRRAVALAAAFGTPELQLDLVSSDQAIFRGHWTFEICLGGQPVAAPLLPWDIVCWESNRRAQWLEIELNLGDGLRIERGMLLAPEDEFVLLMDTVVGPAGADIQYVGRLPLAAGVRAEEQAETRELTLRGERAIARLIPLALNEWRSDPRFGKLSVVEGGLELRQQGREGALCAPLLIDYSRQRRKAPLTWRQLTVGAERRPAARDTAVGYRVHIRKQQWLIYRALRSCANRTVLGQNLATELKVGRFLPGGDVKTIVEIE